MFHIPDSSNFNLKVILAGMMLGFPLSLLFFMDQNIAESMVNSPDNKLVKVWEGFKNSQKFKFDRI